MIPKSFEDRYSKITDFSELSASLKKQLPRAFRINTIKAEKSSVLERFSEYGIEIKPTFYEDAFITNDKRLGNTMEHFNGWIYIQELASMLPPLVMKDSLGETVLDAAAAPGSKTTQLAALMKNKGIIVANDMNYARTKALKFNMEKMGVLNTIITNYNLKSFPEKTLFDSILLDAPCSSEGTIRKDPNVLERWSIKKILGASKLQKSLILKAYDLLKSGGVMVYSTCTFAPEENEEVVDFLLENRECELEKIKIENLNTNEGVDEWSKPFNSEIKKCCRIWPHMNDTGGFFMAKVRKI